MITSSTGNIFRVTGSLWEESIATGGFPSQRTVMRGFGVFFILCLNKRLSKQSRRGWFDTPSRSSWRNRVVNSTKRSGALCRKPRQSPCLQKFIFHSENLYRRVGEYSKYMKNIHEPGLRCKFYTTLGLVSWWGHQMEAFSALLAFCAGNSPVPGEFPSQRPVTRRFDAFFDLRLNKRLIKQWWGWWFETLSCSNYDVTVMLMSWHQYFRRYHSVS